MDYKDIPRRRRKLKRNYLPITILGLCLLIAITAGVLFASSNLSNSDDDKEKISTTNDKKVELIKAKDKSIVMIMGIDNREDDVGRSDTLMVAAVDPKLDKVTLLSIPRDTRVKVRGHGYDKINAAFAYGDVELAESTVENFLGIDIDHYVLLETKSFIKIIDAIGGIDVDVEKCMYYEDPWDDDGGLVIDLYPGKQHMDGKTAVTYVRYRDYEGDIGRVRRQQRFMDACMKKVTSPEIISNIPKIIRESINAIKTDMSLRQLFELVATIKAAAKNGLDTEMVPGYPLYIDGISYWIPDVEQMRNSVVKALGIHVESNIRERFENDAREYKESIPSTARNIPASENNIGAPIRESRQNLNERQKDSDTEDTDSRFYREERFSDDHRNSDLRDSESNEPSSIEQKRRA